MRCSHSTPPRPAPGAGPPPPGTATGPRPRGRARARLIGGASGREVHRGGDRLGTLAGRGEGHRGAPVGGPLHRLHDVEDVQGDLAVGAVRPALGERAARGRPARSRGRRRGSRRWRRRPPVRPGSASGPAPARWRRRTAPPGPSNRFGSGTESEPPVPWTSMRGSRAAQVSKLMTSVDRAPEACSRIPVTWGRGDGNGLPGPRAGRRSCGSADGRRRGAGDPHDRARAGGPARSGSTGPCRAAARRRAGSRSPGAGCQRSWPGVVMNAVAECGVPIAPASTSGARGLDPGAEHGVGRAAHAQPGRGGGLQHLAALGDRRRPAASRRRRACPRRAPRSATSACGGGQGEDEHDVDVVGGEQLAAAAAPARPGARRPAPAARSASRSATAVTRSCGSLARLTREYCAEMTAGARRSRPSAGLPTAGPSR